MIPYALIAAAAEAVQPAAAAETAPATAQQKQSLLESHLNEADDVVRQIHEQGSGFFANLWNNHSDDVIRFVRIIILALVVIVAAKLISLALRKIIARFFKKFEGDESLTYATYTIVRTLIWVIAMLIILDLFGFNTASLLTVLGAAGLAIGLAMKDSLSNIAAGIMLLILRPYKLGDYIDCGSVSGTIQRHHPADGALLHYSEDSGRTLRLRPEQRGLRDADQELFAQSDPPFGHHGRHRVRRFAFGRRSGHEGHPDA